MIGSDTSVAAGADGGQPWSDPRFGRLSKPPPNAQTLWLYLVSGPYATAIPGVVRGGRAAMAEDLDWNLADFDRCFAELADAGVALADWRERVVYFRHTFATAEHRPVSTNVVVRWRRAFDEVPVCELREVIEADLRDVLLGISHAFLRAFDSGRRGPAKNTLEEASAQQQPAAESRKVDNQAAPSSADSNDSCGEAHAADSNCEQGDKTEGSCVEARFAVEPEESAHPCKRLPEEDPEETKDTEIPPVVPPFDFAIPGEQLELVRTRLPETLHLGEPQNARQRRTVDRWLKQTLALFTELSEARRRIDRKLHSLRPSYTSLAGIAGRLEAGKTVEECRYVIAVCEAECRRDRSALRWFNAVSPFRPESFEMKLGMPLDLPPLPPSRFSRAPPEPSRAQPESIETVLARRNAE
jgi:hypothetical protein